ncbi:hypothetical protein RFI_25771 [Reticulomyxa filosa]|uniref:Protein zer-1 homolog-like C-terminal domain-containing protein n=1 Tax=Reticulomyxa filosa TaxID=46433 RepID=X6MEX2_RETFI|nr:hypothetical protein RFI_25771 [Reticulomyxa filosa]|eukprot:ETO11605.1 hypothetical protein RFI_25771 [Reticulomyxa filosa]
MFSNLMQLPSLLACKCQQESVEDASLVFFLLALRETIPTVCFAAYVSKQHSSPENCLPFLVKPGNADRRGPFDSRTGNKRFSAQHQNKTKKTETKIIGGIKLIKKAVTKFHKDYKLCWLASSALWNLARPPANRAIIGVDGVNLLLQMLEQHKNKEKVACTVIGALSNLSLLSNLKDVVAQPIHLDLILQVLLQYSIQPSIAVITSGTSLLANIAVSGMYTFQNWTAQNKNKKKMRVFFWGEGCIYKHAANLVKKQALGLLVGVLTWEVNKEENEPLYRNTCAALNNMVKRFYYCFFFFSKIKIFVAKTNKIKFLCITCKKIYTRIQMSANGFVDNFLRVRGVEHVLEFLKSNNNDLHASLLGNCLVNMKTNTSSKTTSLHLSCLHGKLDILKQLYVQHPEFDLNSTDDSGMTLLDYAISQNQSEIVRFLCCCGVTKHTRNAEQLTEQLTATMKEGKHTLSCVQLCTQLAIADTVTDLPTDLCKLMLTFQHNIDLLQSVSLF